VKVVLVIVLSLVLAGMQTARSLPSPPISTPGTAACASEHCQCGCCVQETTPGAPASPAAPASGAPGQELQPILAALDSVPLVAHPSFKPIGSPALLLSAVAVTPLYVRHCAPLV
jgi:hypothetical protein